MTTKHTRADYMGRPQRCTHREFYGQFVTDMVRKAVLDHIGAGRIATSRDKENFNDIALDLWDRLDYSMRAMCESKLREAGDFWSLSATVCIAKEAARQIMESAKGVHHG